MRRWCVLTIVATVALAAVPAFAEDYDNYDNEYDPSFVRRLGGHRYVPSTLVDWGFVDSYFTSTTYAGFSQFDFSPQDRIARVIGTRETTVVPIQQAFTGAAALTRWLGVTARVSAAGVVPYDGVAAVVVGAHEIYRADAALLVRLVRLDRFQLTARGEVGWGETRSVIPARLPAQRPYVEGDVGTVRPSVIAYLTLARWLGVQASGSYAWRQLDIIQEDDVQTLQGAVALTLAFPRIPLTLIAGFEISHDYNRDFTSVTSIALFGSSATRERAEVGLYYQGGRSLDLGFGAAYDGDDDGDEQRGFVFVNMRYYF